MKTPHVHRDLIVKWANDTSIKIQTRDKHYDNNGKAHYSEWFTITEAPVWFPDCEYRVAPNTIKHREALMSNPITKHPYMVISYDESEHPEKESNFIRWINDWQEVVI